MRNARENSMTATVARWQEQLHADTRPRLVALPHPSWRNNAWLIANPWFEDLMLPALRAEVRRLL
jgi:uracil-DNA glycosylase